MLGKWRAAIHSTDMNDTPKKPHPKTGKTEIATPVPPEESNAHPGAGDGKKAPEIGGRGGADPTRFGDWEKDGRCVDF